MTLLSAALLQVSGSPTRVEMGFSGILKKKLSCTYVLSIGDDGA
jgi:hypothetical protein